MKLSFKKTTKKNKASCSTSCTDADSFVSSVSYDENDCDDSMETLQAKIEHSWRPEKLQAIALRWKLSHEESERLAELRDRLENVAHFTNDPEQVVRFVRETKTTKAAERMFRKFVQFRIEQVDNILSDWDPDPLLKSHFPMTLLNGHDKDGDGIWVERPGVTDVKGLYDRFGGSQLLRYCLWARESACHSPWKQSYQAKHDGQNIRITCVVDVKGLNRSHIQPLLLPVFAELVQGIQNYYCGFIKKIIIIREPPIFKLVWNLVKHCFNENMRELMVFAGSDYENVLSEYIDDIEDVLPPCLLEGGRGTVADGMPAQLEGGRLPPKKKVSWTKSSPGETAEPPPLVQEVSQGSVSSSSSASSNQTHYDCPHKQQEVQSTWLDSTIELNPMTDHESMGIRCQLLAKGSF